METVSEYLARRAQTGSALASLVALPEEERRRQGVLCTAAEILQQPWAWRETARAVFARAQELRAFLERDGGVTNAVFTGAGSSAYTGVSLAPLARRRRGWDARAVPTTDLLVAPADVFGLRGAQAAPGAGRCLLVSLARSGDSPESTGTVDRVLHEFPAVRHLVLCCNAEGALARKYRGLPNVSTVLLPEATNDRSLVMTSSVTSLIVAGQCVIDLDRQDEYLRVLDAMAASAERLLDLSEVARRVADFGPERVCLLAQRALFGGVLEGALKILESTGGRIVSLAETFLGVRHGPLVFLNPRTAVLYFFSADPFARLYERDLVREVAAKRIAGLTVALGPEAMDLPFDFSLASAYDPSIPDAYRPPLDIVFPQMLAMFLCRRCGLQPDSPSEGGVINRVVQGVTLHSP